MRWSGGWREAERCGAGQGGAGRAEKLRKICPHQGKTAARPEKCPDFCPHNGFLRARQENAQNSARTTVFPRPRQKNARNYARTSGFFCPDGAAWGKKWRPCLETKRRRDEEAKGRSGGVERRREGEKERSAKDLGFTTGKCHGGRSVGVCCKLTGVEGGVFYSKPPPKGFQGWSLKI